MKYVKRTKTDIKEDFVNNLLADRGILPDSAEEIKRFYYPTKENLLDYELLDNIEAAADMIEYHIKEGHRIYLVVDCD